MSVDLVLKPGYRNLAISLSTQAELVEAELAELALKQGVLGHFASADFARLIAGQLVSLLQLGLATGSLAQLRRQVEWEIGMSLHHTGVFKLSSDLHLLKLLEQVLRAHLAPALENDLVNFMNHVRLIFEDCWKIAETKWVSGQAIN